MSIAARKGADVAMGAHPRTMTTQQPEITAAQGPAGVAFVLTLTQEAGCVERVQRQIASLVELADRLPEVRDRLLGFPDLAREIRFRQIDGVSAAAGQLFYRLELSDALRELAAACGAGDV